MSAATKKKHVFLEAINNFALPTKEQSIVKVKGPRGNNLHDVESPTGDSFIVTMPVKFRKSLWTKRGDFVIVEPIEEGNKVKAEIVQVLAKDNIRHLKAQGVWPREFQIVDEEQNERDQKQFDRDMFPSSGEDSEYEDQDEDEPSKTKPLN